MNRNLLQALSALAFSSQLLLGCNNDTVTTDGSSSSGSTGTTGGEQTTAPVTSTTPTTSAETTSSETTSPTSSSSSGDTQTSTTSPSTTDVSTTFGTTDATTFGTTDGSTGGSTGASTGASTGGSTGASTTDGTTGGSSGGSTGGSSTGDVPCMMDSDCPEDADLCTTAQCLNSICVQTPGPVDDADPCTDDLCDPMTGIVSHPPAVIDDANVCTTDACTQQDGITHTPVDVDDANVCTVDSCDPEGGILHLPSPCNDNNACTDDTCDPDLGCKFTAKPLVPDGLGCTTDSCNIKTGQPVYTPVANCCEHSMCTLDGKLDAASCTYTGANNDCATKVCAAIPACCNNMWDQACIDATKDPMICPTGGNPTNFSCTCPHSYCTAGAKLDKLCDPCVKKICEVDPFCCNTNWDAACVAESNSICKIPAGMACK